MTSIRRGCLALLLLLPCLPACEGPRLIAGRVRDGAGNPVPHAVLRTHDDVGDVSAERTDSAGRFSLTMIASMLSSRASVRVDAAGYHSRVVRLPFRDGVEVVRLPDSVPLHGLQWSAPETGPLAGVHYGIPLRWSTDFGITRGRWATFDDFAGWYMAVEFGGGGVKGRAGFMRLGRYAGAQLGLAALRTTSHALTVAPDQTFGGAEARFHLIPLAFTFGAYARLAGSAPGDERLFAAGIGVGF